MRKVQGLQLDKAVQGTDRTDPVVAQTQMDEFVSQRGEGAQMGEFVL